MWLRSVIFAFLAFVATPAVANDAEAVDEVLSIISHFAHRHHGPPPVDYDDQGPPTLHAPRNFGSEVLKWLAHEGHPDAFVTGRRNEDCPPTRAFAGGWGVVIKAPGGRPVSGVVCVDEQIGPTLTLDR